MNQPEFSIFYVTCPDLKTAELIGESLLRQKLIACTNILPGMVSQYWWQGNLEKSQETVLLLKGQSANKELIEKQVLSLHPYDTPCFLQIAITDGSRTYLDWLKSI